MTVALLDERQGPPHRHRIDGNLWYVHPLTEEKFLSVTTALDFIESEALSLYWRPGLAAKTAFAELPRLVRAYRIKPCGRTYARCEHDWTVTCDGCGCGECRECVTKYLAHRHFQESRRRADEGSAVHHWIHDWVLYDERDSPIADVLRPYVNAFLNFVHDLKLTPENWEQTETTVLNRAGMWGGTLDAQIRFDATASPAALKLCRKYGLKSPILTVDFKTREHEGAAFWSSNARQLAAYRRGEVILLDDGREEPLPPTDGGLVVQFRPDGYTARPVITDDVTYEAFLANVRSARWEIEHGTHATQVKAFPDLEIPDLPAPVKATRARKAAVPRKTAAAKPTNGSATTAAKPAQRPLAARVGTTSTYRGPEGARLTDSDIPF